MYPFIVQNLVARDIVDARTREAEVVEPTGALLVATPERELMLAVLVRPDGPGNLDTGFGSAVAPEVATPPRDGGRRALAPTTLAIDFGTPVEAARVIPGATLVATVEPADRGPDVIVRGAARSFAARLGR